MGEQPTAPLEPQPPSLLKEIETQARKIDQQPLVGTVVVKGAVG